MLGETGDREGARDRAEGDHEAFVGDLEQTWIGSDADHSPGAIVALDVAEDEL